MMARIEAMGLSPHRQLTRCVPIIAEELARVR
jgi:hypothetical protein